MRCSRAVDLGTPAPGPAHREQRDLACTDNRPVQQVVHDRVDDLLPVQQNVRCWRISAALPRPPYIGGLAVCCAHSDLGLEIETLVLEERPHDPPLATAKVCTAKPSQDTCNDRGANGSR